MKGRCQSKRAEVDAKLAVGGLFVLSLFSCHEKSTVALYFGRIITRLGVAYSNFSGCFFDFLPVNLLLVRATKQR